MILNSPNGKSATEKGVNEISAGEKNLDKEFKENDSARKSSSDNHYGQKHNATKKDRKKQRQNKKKGKQR